MAQVWLEVSGGSAACGRIDWVATTVQKQEGNYTEALASGCTETFDLRRRIPGLAGSLA